MSKYIYKLRKAVLIGKTALKRIDLFDQTINNKHISERILKNENKLLKSLVMFLKEQVCLPSVYLHLYFI